MDDDRLRRTGQLWTVTTVAQSIPLGLTAAGLLALEPMTFPLAAILAGHGWAIPELYANRGSKVLLPTRRMRPGPERVAVGLLGDLVGHDARELYARTGHIVERGRLGVWVLGEAGAVLVRAGGRRLHCFCVRVDDPELPSADRIAHLLLALREDEAGFATVANGAFSGAPWRLRRRLPSRSRPALDAAVAAARALRNGARVSPDRG